ncbi:hypothetical protein XELAEV_18011723mg [Xenopus laevis]|uniref:Uncharacterized protein n=1 Tax=Xenopus laevis TaxID=8355 RepID=A0A974DMF3_XENLA|nr:hypothetical protein XELAEV_18011723mg [Xenopus laevis]
MRLLSVLSGRSWFTLLKTHMKSAGKAGCICCGSQLLRRVGWPSTLNCQQEPPQTSAAANTSFCLKGSYSQRAPTWTTSKICYWEYTFNV